MLFVLCVRGEFKGKLCLLAFASIAVGAGMFRRIISPENKSSATVYSPPSRSKRDFLLLCTKNKLMFGSAFVLCILRLVCAYADKKAQRTGLQLACCPLSLPIQHTSIAKFTQHIEGELPLESIMSQPCLATSFTSRWHQISHLFWAEQTFTSRYSWAAESHRNWQIVQRKQARDSKKSGKSCQGTQALA